jgi:cytochrome c oxidase subunit 2
VTFAIPGRLVFCVAALLALAFAQPANAAFAPDPAHSPNADDMRVAYWVMIVLGILIALALAGGLLVAVRRFRSKGSDEEPRQLTAGRGFIAKVGAGLTALALAIFVFGVVVSNGVKEADAEDGTEEIEIQAVAQQWLWRFGYPEQAEGSFSEGINTIFSYGELVVPVDTLVNLNIRSTDVIHSWFVPALGPQVWAVPGETQELSFIADEEGVYTGQSTVFSGAAGYPVMRAVVRVVSADEYADYIEQHNTELQEGQAAVREAAETQIAAENSDETADTDESAAESGDTATGQEDDSP